jgi:hypothetical protein
MPAAEGSRDSGALPRRVAVASSGMNGLPTFLNHLAAIGVRATVDPKRLPPIDLGPAGPGGARVPPEATDAPRMRRDG